VVAADEEGVGGFVLGAIDTVTWEERLERSWWPRLRRQYPAPNPEARGSWNADQRRISMIHNPEHAPIQVVREFPAHLHLNLAPRLQGRGVGTRLFHAWLRLAEKQGGVGNARRHQPSKRARGGFLEQDGVSVDHAGGAVRRPDGMDGPERRTESTA
jgi:GNAT superfamily N-acetyltransferase